MEQSGCLWTDSRLPRGVPWVARVFCRICKKCFFFSDNTKKNLDISVGIANFVALTKIIK